MSANSLAATAFWGCWLKSKRLTFGLNDECWYGVLVKSTSLIGGRCINDGCFHRSMVDCCNGVVEGDDDDDEDVDDVSLSLSRRVRF